MPRRSEAPWRRRRTPGHPDTRTPGHPEKLPPTVEGAGLPYGHLTHQPIAITLQGQRPTSAKALLAPENRPLPSTGKGSGRVRSLYIHVPFCFHKCHYCDFYSFVDKGDQQESFVSALECELRALEPFAFGARGEARLDTVFVGGGTPSLLRVNLWEHLLGLLDELFGTATGNAEFTVECNPETVTPELMGVLRAGGVNRVSMGAQSFNPAHLKTLERWHDPASVRRALELAADAGITRRSIDLIFGVPGQSLGDWRDDLGRALGLADPATGPGLDHLSCYDLTYEPNTAMTMRMRRGEFEPASEDLEIDMFRLTRSVLRDAGLEAYEISNFARGGAARCRHNLAYWRQEQWLAAGPSAAAHAGGWRWKNAPHLGEWRAGVVESGGYAPVIDLEPPDAARALRERLMTGLRLAEGVDAAAMVALAGRLGVGDALVAEVEAQRAAGRIAPGGERWVLTEEGTLVADGVASALMRTVRSA